MIIWVNRLTKDKNNIILLLFLWKSFSLDNFYKNKNFEKNN